MWRPNTNHTFFTTPLFLIQGKTSRLHPKNYRPRSIPMCTVQEYLDTLWSKSRKNYSHRSKNHKRETICVVSGPHRLTENSNCVILNGAKRSEESWFYAGWEARFFALTGSE
jgi:hypothetical protein